MTQQVRVPRQQVPLVDPRTGVITREWFNSLNAVTGSVSTLSTDDVALISILLHTALKAAVFSVPANSQFAFQ